MIYECDQCQAPLPPNVNRCPRCGETFDELVPADAEAPAKGFTAKQAIAPSAPKSVQGLETKQLIGLAGAIILFVGVFAPIISVPVAGSMNYFQNGKGDGTIIIGLAIISVVLSLTRRYIGLWLTGVVSLGLLAFTYLNLQAHLSGAQEAMGVELAGNPFKGLGDIMLQSVQIQWGWALLVVGALSLIGAAALKSELRPDDNTTSQRINHTAPVMSAVLLAVLVGGSVAYTQHEKTQMPNEAKARVAKETEVKRQQQDSEQQAEAAQQQASQAEDQAKQDALNHLTLGTWTWDSTEYSRALVGTIRNDSSRTIDFASVNFNLLDKDGDKVGTADDTIVSLNPGETWKFRAIVFQDAAQRATLDGIKGRAEASTIPSPSTPDSPPPALPLSQLPANAWPLPKKMPTYASGKSLDKVLIGQSREALLATIGRKPDDSHQFKDGANEDNWTTKYRDRSGTFDNRVSVMVLYRQGKVIQAEYSASDDGPKLPSFNKLISQNKRLTKVCYGVDNYDDKGQPEGGYVQFYYDDVQQGIAYGTSLQDDFILTSSPGSIVVHNPNVPVVLEVANAKIRVETGREAAVYRTQAEADRADKALMP